MNINKVSIIIPAYNAGKYLKRCLTSAFKALSSGESEIIVIDDGSTDNTKQVLDDFIEGAIPKPDGVSMQIIHQQNKGPGYARNIGLAKASGDYIVFLDADDCLPKHSIDHMIRQMNNDNTDICLGKMRYVIAGIPVASSIGFWHNMDGTRIVNMNDQNCLVEVYPGIGAKIFRRTLFEDFIFPINIKWEDMPLMLTLLARAERISLLHEGVYDYHIHLNTTIRDFLFKNNIFNIITGLDVLKENLISLGLYDQYEQEYLSVLTLHTMFRAQNALTWVNVRAAEKQQIITDLLDALTVRYHNWENDKVLCDDAYRYKDPLFIFLQKRLPTH